ncbi:acyltransferase [uncultured Desulfosarcina sp.]|uniref:acyltransferase n=1 Tax=uncultured Desulfosarcina sp. TaxID=218289 RepID=UPI0029C78529|nr:acyltransferase [uncultured Desulfosarcina sp.]
MKTANRLQRWYAWQLWKRRFGWYARSAYFERPDLVVNPQGIHLDWGALIRAHARLECVKHEGQFGQIEIGEGSSAQFYFHCAAAKRVSIGQHVLIAGRVYITDHDHQMPWREGGMVVRPVMIGDGCWLGEGCAILKGVELGPGCVVGANTVVTKSFEAGSVIGGVPARVIKDGAYKPAMSVTQR